MAAGFAATHAVLHLSAHRRSPQTALLQRPAGWALAARRRQSTPVVRAYFDLPRWSSTAFLESINRRDCMRRWLERELCMSEKQARGVLARCPALGELDVRLARRRMRHLDRQLGLSRMEAALLVLARPAVLLPPASDVVGFALGRRAPQAGR